MNQIPNANEALWHLLYRYLWPFQYFRNTDRGSPIERAQNYRYNRQHRTYLPAFAVKWLLLAVLAFTSGTLFAQTGGLVVPAACCYLTATGALIVMFQTFVAWAWLAWFPERY